MVERDICAAETAEGVGVVLVSVLRKAAKASRSLVAAARRVWKEERSRSVHSVQMGWSMSEREERISKSRAVDSIW